MQTLTLPAAPASESLDAQIARAALSKLLGKGHFSVCPVREAAEIMGKKFTPEDSARLSALHCVDYASMSAPVLDYLRAVVVGVLE